MSAEAKTPETEEAYAKSSERNAITASGREWYARCLAMYQQSQQMERERDEARRERDALRELADKYATVIAEYDFLAHVIERKERDA